MQFFIDFLVFFVEKTYVVACAIVIIYNIIDNLSLSIDDHQKRHHIDDDHSHYYYQVATIMIVLKKNIISIFISHTKPKTNDTGNS